MNNDQRTLVMEDLGFDPAELFTEEQIEKMRSMKPRGQIRSGRLTSYVKIADRNDMS